MATKSNIGKMNQRMLVEQHDEFTQDVLGGTGNNWYPFYSVLDVAESGTTTTNIKMVAHGMTNGDYIINKSRTNTVRSITVVDLDNITVTAITGQITGDSIDKRCVSNSIIWTELKPYGGSKYFGDDHLKSNISHKVRTRFRSDLGQKSEFRMKLMPEKTRIFEIQYIRDTDESNKEYVIYVTENPA